MFFIYFGPCAKKKTRLALPDLQIEAQPEAITRCIECIRDRGKRHLRIPDAIMRSGMIGEERKPRYENDSLP